MAIIISRSVQAFFAVFALLCLVNGNIQNFVDAVQLSVLGHLFAEVHKLEREGRS